MRSLSIPSQFCLYRNDDTVTQYLNALYTPDTVLHLDFSHTENMTAAATLALIAHINNIQCSKNNKGCFVFQYKDSPIYKSVFIQAQLLRILKSGRNIDSASQLFHFGDSQSFAAKRTQIYHQLDGYEAEQISNNHKHETQIKAFFSYMRRAVSEVLLNISHHAYPVVPTNDTGEGFNHYTQKAWWAMFWKGNDGYIHFLVYDLGVGIPSSYVKHATKPRSHVYQVLDDSHILQEASQNGMSRCIGEGRGNGLANVIEDLKNWQDSMLLIRSGKARAELVNGQFTTQQTQSVMQGTLIEWAFNLSGHQNDTANI